MKFSRNSFRARAYIVYIAFLGAAVIINVRLFGVQVRDHAEHLARAESQQRYIGTMEPERGRIFLSDRNDSLHAAAVNKYFPYLYVVPKEITDHKAVTNAILDALELSRETVERRVNKPGDPYEMIARRIPDDAAEKIAAYGLAGVYIGRERRRFYPLETLAADIIGFSRETEHGRIKGEYGIEALFDNKLRGRPGSFYGIRDAFGNAFLRFKRALPMPGSSIVLTLDPNIQFRAEELIRAATERWDARGGSAIVLNAASGEILAMANYPSFDPNEFWKKADYGIFMNKAVSARFEPGSVFKPITMAIALEKGALTPETTYDDKGALEISGHIIRNADLKAHGTVTMTRVMEQSYNIGMVVAAQKTGNEAFRDFLANTLRLEERTGIDLPGEIRGDLSGLFPPNARPINFATAAFGHGIAVTPLKLAQAFGALANGGALIEPRIISQIRHPDGRADSTEPRVVAERLISQNTARNLTRMLVSVIENGTGRRARIRGYTVAGKTGTAQIPDPKGRGYTDETIHSFVAYTPYSSPQFVVLIKLDRPIGVRFAEGSVVPAARTLLEFVLQYYAVPPDRPEELQ